MTTPRNTTTSRIQSNSYYKLLRILDPILAPRKTFFSGIPVLPDGDPAYGEAFTILFGDDGKGFDNIITRAAKVATAEENEKGRCQWHIHKTRAVLVTKPCDIAGILSTHLDDLILHDATGSFEQFFGRSIFGMPYGSKHKKIARSQFMQRLFTNEPLTAVMEKMQGVATRYVEKIASAPHGQVDFKEMTNFIALDMIGLNLGLKDVDDAVKRKAIEIIDAVTVETSTFRNQTLCQLLTLYKIDNPAEFEEDIPSIKTRAISSINSLFALPKMIFRALYKTNLDRLLEQGGKIIQKEILRPNEENILGTENELNKSFPQKPASKSDLYTQTSLALTRQYYAAGSDTTKNLLNLTLMLLVNHPKALEKVQQEIEQIAQESGPPETWTRKELNKMHGGYFNACIMETLRLYPPIPSMVLVIKKAFSFDDINFRENDVIIMSQRTTHLLESVWKDAMQYNPERFFNAEEKQYKTQYDFKDYTFFPFGIFELRCPGQNFAIQEVMLTLVRILWQFDVKFHPSFTARHPFSFSQVFTMSLDAEKVDMCFTPRPGRELVLQKINEEAKEEIHPATENASIHRRRGPGCLIM